MLSGRCEEEDGIRMDNIKNGSKTALISFILLLSILLIPFKVLGEESKESKLNVKEFRIVGNTVINIDTIRSRLIKEGITARVEQGLRVEEFKKKR